MVTNFRVKIGDIGLFTFIHRLGLDWSIAISTLKDRMAMMWLHRVKILWTSV